MNTTKCGTLSPSPYTDNVIGLVMVTFLHGAASSDPTLTAIHLVVILGVVLTD